MWLALSTIIVPIVIVFTQYDKLVRMKVKASERNPIARTMAERRGEEEADKEFQRYVRILKDDIGKIGIPVPIFVRASGAHFPSIIDD